MTGARTGDRAVARVAYASRARVDGSVYAEMERIRAAAVRHNVPLGVHTALLYQSGWFLQWKEGPGDALLRLMARVAGDPRHDELRIVHSSRGPRLLDGPWSMGIVQSAEPPEVMEARVHALRQGRGEGWQGTPPAIWRQLSTPVRHVGAHLQADPDAFQRVLVCCATSTLSFDLVQWLARRHGQAVLRRRFAGAADNDVATDVVDFDAGYGLMRMIAMARRGLEVPLTRAFLADYAHAVLLFGDDPARNARLVRRMAEACAGRPFVPQLLGVAQAEATHAAARATAHGLGLAYRGVTPAGNEPQDLWAALEPPLSAWRPEHRIVSAPVPLERLVA